MYFRKPRLRDKPVYQLPARRQTRYVCTKLDIYVFIGIICFKGLTSGTEHIITFDFELT